ncbi:MFS transporter [Chelatococcus sambhunathii]|uniref:MFS transporter n=1 Tax=Chelatococcus sambhunathii TaxID=363953 RepID=A0ABU1DJZ4_9HYPH|nr:MFS transporter [Chelatococcus sambhunathii]MDR4308447.1 MFS transporter [Chelatococcus sambhunathii]
MLMDISSEMIHALLPVYMVTVLGASALAVGVIEGVAEATASIVKVFSGALSDWLGRRKFLALLGYGLAAVTKPIFPLASSIDWLIAARFIDRVGKGIRGAPRDALVADISPPELRGASFGLRQSLDSIGAFAGPLIAIGLMWAFSDHIPTVFWFAVIPAVLCVAVLLLAVKEPPRPEGMRPARSPLRRDELARLGATYWWVVGVAAVFTLARFSEAFLILRAQQLGLPLWLAPAPLVLMALAYSLSAYPAGVLADRMNKTTLLAVGLVLLAAADLALAVAPGLGVAAAGVVLWGLHMGFTQGLFAALVAEASPPELRGTAFGVFNLVSGVALLLASVVAGALWTAIGSQWTFLAGAGFTLLTMCGLLRVGSRLSPGSFR